MDLFDDGTYILLEEGYYEDVETGDEATPLAKKILYKNNINKSEKRRLLKGNVKVDSQGVLIIVNS